MTYEEYKKQRLAQNNTQSNVSNTTKINTAPVNRYEEYKKQRLAQNSFDSSKNIRKFNNILENGQKMKINMTPTQAIIEKGKQLYQEPNMLKNIKPEMSYAGDVIDKENISKNGNQNVAIGSIKSLGANALDATVDTLQYPKNAFKSEMKREERKDLELAIKLQNGFRGTKNQLTDEQANEFINYVKNKYNVSDFQNELNNINEWTYKENKLESATNELVSRVSEENSRLGKVGQRITNAFGSVGRMMPTIGANMVAPGTGMGTLYMSSAQSSQDEALRNGASYNDAVANGILSGALEVGTEAIGGERIAKLTGIPTLASKLGIRTGIIGDIVSEEIEEMISTTVQPFIDRITYNPNAPMATKEDYWNTFIDTALSTVLLMGVGEGINTVTEYRDKAISKVNESNMSVEQKQQSISEIEKGANELIDKVKNNAKNSTNINENTPNIDRISQNNVQNVSELQKSTQNNGKNMQNNLKNDDMGVFDTEREYNTSSLPKNEEEVETNVRNRLNKEIEKDIEIFVENNTDDYQEIASSDVDYEIEDILRKMYTEEEIDYLYDTDLSSEVFNKISDIISNELEKHFYTYNSETGMYEPNTDKLGNSDEIRFKYDKLPSTDFEYKQLDNIRNMIDDLTWDMKKTLPDGIDITVDESRASADATYITVSNENTDETYEIRVGNHFKSGTSGDADEHIRISDFKTISKLKENLKEKIENGLIDVGGENRQNDTINEQKEKHDVDIIKESDYNNYEVERKKEPRNYIYKNITDEDKARVDSDYKLNKSKYIGKNFVHFDDVSYGYNIEDGEVKVTSKFKGSQKFIREVEEAWENGVDKLSNGNTKITESIRRIKRGGDTSNGISRKQSSSRESDRENIGNGRQQRGIDSTKTSENNGNNLKDSKQSSFSLPENINLKKKQLEIIQKENPAPDDYHTWIRSQDDIKTFDEVINDDESFVWGDFNKEDAKRALENGYVTIYSSQPIKNGVFVSTSKNQASDYAGGGKIYQKQVSLQEVAWINGDEGQYAKLSDTKYSQSNGEWSKYLKENWDLMPNSKKTFGFPTNEQLQTMDNKKISESADTLNLKEVKRPQKEETYKTNLERSSGLIEQKIKAIEEGKIKRDENAKRVSKEDIRKTIENSINQKLFTKHFRKKAYGIYKPNTDTIRLAQRSDFETAIHELGHQIDIKQLDNLSHNADIKVKAELRMLCERSFPGTYKKIRTQLAEGFAEATRNFIIDSKSFATDYPNTAYLIQNELEKSPQLNKLFNTLQEQIHDYINMTPKDRVLSNVSFEGEEQKPKLTKEYIKDKVIEWVWDDTIPLKRLVEKIAKTKNVKVDNLSPSENIAMSLKLAEGLGDATVSSLRNGYEENGVKQTKGFSEILKDFDHNDIEDLVAYMVSEGNLDYIKANKQTGIRESDAQAMLKEYKDTKIDKASKEIRKINNYSLQRLLQSGLITKEQIKSFKNINEHYVPMNRVIDMEGKIGLNAKGLQNGKVIKGRKGSDRMIINPLESTVVNNMRIDRQIANNENLKNLVDTLKQNDLLGDYIDEIPTPMQFKGSATLENFKVALEKQGVDTTELDLEAVYNIFTPKLSDDKNLIMSYMENGKRKYIQFKDKSLYNIVNGLTGQKGLNGIQKFYSYFNGALRWGATAGNIDFSLPNTISDSQTAFLNSDATFIPIVDSIIGVADAVAGNTAEHSKLSKLVEKIAPDYQKRKARLYELYEKSGAKSTTNRSGLKRSNNLDNVLGALALDKKTLLGKDKARPISAIKKATEWAPALSEEATRFRNFEKEVKLYQKQGMRLEDAVKKAGYNAKRVTQDFSQSGKATRVVNSVIPFTSARIGGTYQAYENFAKNPKRYSTRLALLTASSAVIHALLIQALKSRTRKDEEEYKELQDQKLLDNYTFPIGDGKTITIKKIQGPVRAIINLTEMAVDYSMGMIDDKGLDKRLKAIANDVKMDNSYIGKMTDVAGQFGTPILENALNKDFYYGNDLIPENMKYLDNANKYDENTTETAKLIGKVLNYPPIYIDNLIEGYLAGVGTQIMQASDWVINKVTGKKTAKRQASESFITKRFIADDYKNSQSVSEIYDTYDELKNDEAEGRLTEEQKKQLENIEQAKDTMAIINKKIREAKTDNTLNSREKAEKIRELQKQRTDTARYYLGKETITKENKEQIELYEYYPTATSKISSIIDEEEKNEYAQIVKDTYAFNLKSLEDNKEYIKANEEKKISMKKTVLTQAKNTAKEKMIQNNLEELVEEHGEEETATLILNEEQLKQYEKVEKAGIPLVDYYNAWLAQKDAEGKKNAKGENNIRHKEKKLKLKQ